MSLSDASNVASAVRFGINPTPLGAAGLGLGLASSFLGGKGGKKDVVIGGTPGAYTTNGEPFPQANQYLVHGKNADYNMIAAAGLPRDQALQQFAGDPDALRAYNRFYPENGHAMPVRNNISDYAKFDNWMGKYPDAQPSNPNTAWLTGNAGNNNSTNNTMTPIGGLINPMNQQQTYQSMANPGFVNSIGYYAQKNNQPLVNPTGTFNQFIKQKPQKLATALSTNGLTLG